MDTNNDLESKPVLNDSVIPTTEPVSEPSITKEPEPVTDNNPVVDQEVAPATAIEEPITLAGKEEVILEIKPKKERGSLGIILLFGILIGFIFFMPQLMPYIKNFLGENDKPNPIVNNEKPDQPDDKDEKEAFYKLSETPTIKNSDLVITNIVIAPDDKNDYYVTFDLENVAKSSFDFSKKYFLQLYNDDHKLLSRAKVYSSSPLASGAQEQIKLRIKAEAATTTQVSLMALTEADYPIFTLNHDDEGNQKMTCSLNNEKYIYNFLNYELKTIDYTNNVLNTDYLTPEEYQIAKEIAALTVATWNGVEGISALYSDVNSGYTITSHFTMTEIATDELKDLKKPELFSNNEAAKVVGFEMGTMGYTCQKDEG